MAELSHPPLATKPLRLVQIGDTILLGTSWRTVVFIEVGPDERTLHFSPRDKKLWVGAETNNHVIVGVEA